jgi:predicted membrane-bound spermidine synthase
MTSTQQQNGHSNDAAAAAAAAAAIEIQRAKAGFYFREDMSPGLVLEMTLKQIYHSTHSKFQQIDVVDTYFGKTLITDGKTQSTQFDEFAYHESLVHPAMLNFTYNNNHHHHQQQQHHQENGQSSGPKTVFIGGGGELATAREVLRHASVEKCIMVDLDGEIYNVIVDVVVVVVVVVEDYSSSLFLVLHIF